MRRLFGLVVLGGMLIASVACSVTTDSLPAGAIVVRNGTLVDGTGAAPISNGLLVIKDGKIVAVGSEAQFQVPADARVVDARGGTILPGLIDSHTHILGVAGRSQAVLGRWLKAGVTTVRDLGSEYKSSADASSLTIRQLKQRLAQYGNTVPTLVIAGPLITAPGGYPVPVRGSGIALEVGDVDEAQQAAEQLLAGDADMLKIALDGGHPLQPWPLLSLDQVKAIVAVAHHHNTRVSAHVWRANEAQLALDGGVDDLAHIPVLSRMSDELIEQLVARRIAIMPTLVVEDQWGEFKLAAAQWKKAQATRNDNLRRFLAAGGTIALGSDFGNPGIPQGLPLPELQRMIELGMAPMQVLVAATRHAAQVCGVGDRLGTLEPGKQADVIVVDGDPLTDITALQNVIVVVKNGEVVVAP